MDLRVGEGWRAFSWCRSLTEEIKKIRDADEKILALLDKGEHFQYSAIYACPLCRDWFDFKTPYIYEPIRVTPFGTVREYKLHYLNSNPTCPTCGSDLYHIYNPLSTNNLCPKCGADNMNAKYVGNWD